MSKKQQPEALQLPTLPFAVFDEFGQPCEDRVRDHFAAAFEALRAQIGQGVPDGWQLVPKEPTDAMIRAALHLDLSYMPGHDGPDRAAVYKAMLASAPPAPKQKPLTDEQKEVIAFLYGEAPLEGVWFGENHYARHGKYWWRHHLVNAFGSSGGIKGEKK